MIYLPINCNLSTAGHKLQGKTLDSLVVNSWAYNMPHWIYVVLSRVRSLNSLVINEKLDESRDYKANQKVLEWERKTRQNVERKTFEDRGKKDFEQYLIEEKSTTLSSLSDSEEFLSYCEEIKYNLNPNKCSCEELGKKFKISPVIITQEEEVSDHQQNLKDEQHDESNLSSDIKLPTPMNMTTQETMQDIANISNDVKYVVNVNGKYFKFIDVPGDGDCYFHCCLKQPYVSDKFDSVREIRSSLQLNVQHLYNSDPILKRLFEFEKKDYKIWCREVIVMGTWAGLFEQLIFSYFMKINLVVVGNYLNGFISSDMQNISVIN